MIFTSNIRHIHIIGIAGTAMGSFAGLLKNAGYQVSGSDESIYSPMKEQLERWKIPVLTPYGEANLHPKPDLVVVGNVVSEGNIEAVAMRKLGLPFCSFPQALSELFLKDSCSVVATGTHGKTTCSSLLAHTLESAGFCPNFLIGGIPKNFGMSSRMSVNKSKLFVLEGDEYDTAYFDKTPKFLHYRPQHVLCTSIEFDHADIFSSVDEITQWFKKLFSLVPADGAIVVNSQSPEICRAVAEGSISAQIIWYGREDAYLAKNCREDFDGISFDLYKDSKFVGELALSMSGQHNIDNALGCYALLSNLGLSHEQISHGFSTFLGATRRMDVLGTARGITVIDDFAHHPSAVKTTLEGVRKKYPTSTIWALFEPRSATSCRSLFQEQYASSFNAADRVFIAQCGRTISGGLDTNLLAQSIYQHGVPASSGQSTEEIVKCVVDEAVENTVVLCMSNGAFGGIHKKILSALSDS